MLRPVSYVKPLAWQFGRQICRALPRPTKQCPMLCFVSLRRNFFFLVSPKGYYYLNLVRSYGTTAVRPEYGTRRRPVSYCIIPGTT